MDDNTEKVAFSLSSGKTEVHLFCINCKGLLFFQSQALSVDAVLHLAGKARDHFDVLVPMIENSIIGVSGEEAAPDGGRLNCYEKIQKK